MNHFSKTFINFFYQIIMWLYNMINILAVLWGIQLKNQRYFYHFCLAIQFYDTKLTDFQLKYFTNVRENKFNVYTAKSHVLCQFNLKYAFLVLFFQHADYLRLFFSHVCCIATTSSLPLASCHKKRINDLSRYLRPVFSSISCLVFCCNSCVKLHKVKV